MDVNIDQGWKLKLDEEFKKTYFNDLVTFVKKEYAEQQCFPKAGHIFRAFDSCKWNDLKVVIIGQDPYHGLGQANGLCFSVNKDIAFPPSLVNIFKEISSDIGKPIPLSGNLDRWASQGVMLLNATLTVRAHQAGSHQGKGWERFTNAVIERISDEKEKIVFMLWGGYAKSKISLVDKNKHYILSSGHPSPLSANRGFWFGNKHFSKCNDYLISNGIAPIDW